MAPFSNLLAALGDVPDPRRAQGKRYPLPYLLMFTVLVAERGQVLPWRHHLPGAATGAPQSHFGVDLSRAPVVNTLQTVLQPLPSNTS